MIEERICELHPGELGDARLSAEPRWIDFSSRLTPLVARQRSRILLPFALSPEAPPYFAETDAAPSGTAARR